MPSFDALRTIFILSILYNSVFALPEPLQSISSTVGSTFSRGLNSWKKRQTSVPRSVWILEDVYEGSTFFNNWTFFSDRDPTNGSVDYVDRETAFATGLAGITEKGEVFMRGDNTTWLPSGVHRPSVRISSNKWYNGGLFLLDLTAAPWGCGIWPAYWTFGQSAVWPAGGEIDIIEGVHDNIHNQVAFHTPPGCVYTPSDNYTGTPKQLDCDANINSNAGCGVTDWSRVSYGETFTSQGGGVYAMKWDDESIAVWYFYRATLPQDIVDGMPDPTTWSKPSAELSPQGCDIGNFFYNHSIIFDITFCGDWAGNTYEVTPSCPGTCADQIMNPTNFDNALWIINNLKVFQKTTLNGTVTNDSTTLFSISTILLTFTTILSVITTTLLR